jgi:phenylalanyl-tRNA synthetase beta chain
MGGIDSEVSEKTVNVALEAAKFAPARVRRASRLLGLSSEASLRFERGVDLNTVKVASDRATYLMLQHCTSNGKGQAGAFSFTGQQKRSSTEVGLRLNQIERLLGIRLSALEVKELLHPLGFEWQASAGAKSEDKPESLKFLVPSFRQSDVSREVDLIEEVCRTYGYENIPEEMPSSTLPAVPPDDIARSIRDCLSGQGLSEAYISSLVPDESEAVPSGARNPDIESLSQDASTLVRVLNPLSKDHQVLRQSLLPGLLKAVAYNKDRGEKDRAHILQEQGPQNGLGKRHRRAIGCWPRR